MDITADQARRLAEKIAPPAQLSQHERIQQHVAAMVALISRQIQEAAAIGHRVIWQRLSKMPLPDHLERPSIETAKDVDYRLNCTFAESEYDYSKCPRSFWGKLKMSRDFRTNIAYLNQVNSAVVDHFTSLGYIVTLAFIPDEHGMSTGEIGLAISWA